MRRQQRSILHVILVTILTISFLYACETWRDECADYGEVIVVNPIPDTTIYLNDGPLIIDLFAPPVVLKQTADQSIGIHVLEDDGSIVDGTNVTSPTTGEVNAVKLVPRKEGTTTVRILAGDACMEIETSFEVTVVDTTNNEKNLGTTLPTFN